MTNTLVPATLTRNILRVYRSATPAQIAAGREWYAEAHRVAHTLAGRYGVTPDQAAGVIAATSPLNSWAANVRISERILAAGGLSEGYLTVGLRKADAILAGADIVATLKSDKVVNFFECIRANGETQAVCVDRHAADIALGVRHTDATRPSIKGRRYAELADAYRRAGARVGVSPAVLQAITWLTWRNRFWAVGAFDLRETA
jgi:hypothetical protein